MIRKYLSGLTNNTLIWKFLKKSLVLYSNLLLMNRQQWKEDKNADTRFIEMIELFLRVGD